ncbi:MAG: hypothetical protein WCK90_04620 [archaeon]
MIGKYIKEKNPAYMFLEVLKSENIDMAGIHGLDRIIIYQDENKRVHLVPYPRFSLGGLLIDRTPELRITNIKDLHHLSPTKNEEYCFMATSLRTRSGFDYVIHHSPGALDGYMKHQMKEAVHAGQVFSLKENASF